MVIEDDIGALLPYIGGKVEAISASAGAIEVDIIVKRRYGFE